MWPAQRRQFCGRQSCDVRSWKGVRLSCERASLSMEDAVLWIIRVSVISQELSAMRAHRRRHHREIAGQRVQVPVDEALGRVLELGVLRSRLEEVRINAGGVQAS